MIRTAHAPFPDRVIGELAFDMGLLMAATRARLEAPMLVRKLSQGDGEAHAEFRTQVARALAGCLRWEETSIRALYVIGSAANGSCRPTSDLDIVVVLPERDRRIEATLDLVAEDISDAYRSILPDIHDEFSLLDLHYVTDVDIEANRGFAPALKGSNIPRFPINSIQRTKLTRNTQREA